MLRTLALAALLLCSVACRDELDVRFDPTPLPVVRTMLQMAAVGPNDVVYDLGSGDGRVVIMAAEEFGARGVGIEIDPALVERARATATAAGVAGRVQFRVGDMYAADVSEATVVALFLHPEPNLKLRPTLLAQLRPGSRVVSYLWDMGDWKPDEVRNIAFRRRVYLWRIPKG
jgi:SAM-dependent methyltransferase